ncbi:hypothetical protein [Actibacterium sp. MT2.3-13A]|uniref:hypothetical protein n=1 Tax=Actibacterium sp. MT2.3-13A TaxID=2828332 RepID=UPI001BADAAE2|nr:hypothetical protein [Actibacterium sp. MT2.3-13A]
MHISFSPQRRDDTLNLSKSGDILTVNGADFDFSDLAEGAVLPREAVACDWLASDVARVGGAIRLTLILPHGADAPEAVTFPQPIILSDAPIHLPGDAHPPVSA